MKKSLPNALSPTPVPNFFQPTLPNYEPIRTNPDAHQSNCHPPGQLPPTTVPRE